jgi:hypothetical protein
MLFPATRSQCRLLTNAAMYQRFKTAGTVLLSRGAVTAGANLAMATNTDPQSEVLHSETHSRLSSEEIARAVARHNKNHPMAKVESAPADAQNAPVKAKKGPKSLG